MLTALRNSTTEPQKGIKTFRGAAQIRVTTVLAQIVSWMKIVLREMTDQGDDSICSQGAATASASSTAGSLVSCREFCHIDVKPPILLLKRDTS